MYVKSGGMEPIRGAFAGRVESVNPASAPVDPKLGRTAGEMAEIRKEKDEKRPKRAFDNDFRRQPEV